ncbi:hypothetical protein J7M07_01515, partial [bacterium]|nr:hypothetical protein [bacterium]
MTLKKPQIWILTESNDFKEYFEEKSILHRMPYHEFKNISEVLAMEEPGEGITFVIDQSGKFNSYLPIVKRFQKKFISYDVIVFGEYKTEDIIRDEYLEGVDQYITPDMDKEDVISKINHIVTLR